MGETSEACELPEFIAGSEEIKQILEGAKTVAVVGVSRDPNKDSHIVAQYLRRYYQVYFINPNADVILGQKVYKSLHELPEPPDIVDIFRPSSEVSQIVDDAIAIKAKTVWMQVGIVNNEAAVKAKNSGLKVVMNRCIMVEHHKLNDHT